MGINPRTTQTYLNEDQRWIGPGGLLHWPENYSGVLDRSAFTGTFTDGYVPSGVVVSQLASTGLLVPYAGATNEEAVITRTATGGTVDFIFDGETAADVSVVAATTAAQVQTALESLSNINAGDVAVTGAAGGPFTVEFTGQYAGQDIPDLEIDDTDATGGTVLVEVTDGGSTGSGGSETPFGFLAVSVVLPADAAAADDELAAVYMRGVIEEAMLPDDSGFDDNARTAFGSRFIYV